MVARIGPREPRQAHLGQRVLGKGRVETLGRIRLILFDLDGVEGSLALGDSG